MSSRHKQDTRPASDRTEEPTEVERPAERPDDDSTARAAEASASAASLLENIDEILDDADESLLATLGFEPGQKVDPAEVEARAEILVGQYQQKGGQ